MLSEEELEEFENYLIKSYNLEPSTAQVYRTKVRIFFRFIQKSPDELEIPDLLRFFEWQYDNGISASTMNTYMSSIRAYLDYLIYTGYLERNVAREFRRRFKTPKRLPEVMTVEEMEKMILAPLKYQKNEKRAEWEAAVMTVLSTSGIRLSELFSLNKNRVDIEKRMIRVIGKRNKEREIPIITKWFKSIDVLAFYEYLFYGEGAKYKRSPITIYRFIVKYGKKLFPKRHITPHTFRHSFCTALIKDGVPLHIVRDIMGHRSIYITELYLHLAKKDVIEELRKVGAID